MLYTRKLRHQNTEAVNTALNRVLQTPSEKALKALDIFFKTINSVHLHNRKMNAWKKKMVQEIRAGLAIITVICQRQCMVLEKHQLY